MKRKSEQNARNYPTKVCRIHIPKLKLSKFSPQESLETNHRQNGTELDECITVSSTDHSAVPRSLYPGITDDIIKSTRVESLALEKFHATDMVSNRSFQPLKMIGEGNFGKVVLSRKIGGLDNGKLYAVKYQPIAVSLKSPDYTVNERNVLSLVRGHNFLCQMQYAFKTQLSLVFVMDFAAGGELFRYNNNHQGIGLELLRIWAGEMVCGLETLHERQIIYRDLKLENVLIDEQGHILLTDFGLARELQGPDFYDFPFGGTLPYMAPEVLTTVSRPNKTRGYTFSVDLWSLGIILFELATGADLFGINSVEDTAESALRKTLLGSIELSPQGIGESVGSTDLGDLIYGLVNWNPVTRLRLAEVKQHGFFHVVHWFTMQNKGYKPRWKPAATADGQQDLMVYFDEEFTSQPIPTCTSEPPMEILEGRAELFKGFEFVSPNYRSHVLQQPLQEPGNAASGPSSTFSGLRESIDSAEIIEPPVQEWQLRRNEYASLQVSRPYKPKLCVKAIEEELNMAININNVKNSMNTKYLLFPSKMVPVPTQCEGDTIMTKFRKLTASKKNETAPAIHEVKRTQRFPAYLRQNCRRSDRLAAKLRVNFKY